MLNSLTSLRRPITLASVVGLLAMSAWQFGTMSTALADEPQAAPAPALASGGTIVFQEEIAPHYLRFGPSTARGGENYAIYKFSPFRTASSDGTVTYYTELFLGYGGGAMASARLDESLGLDSTSRSLLNGKLFTSAERFTSVIRFNLTNDKLAALDTFFTEMENVMLDQPDPMVTYRFVDGYWGDFRIRKDTSGGLSVLVGQDADGYNCWEAIDAPSFHAAIKASQKRIEQLAAKPVSGKIQGQ